LKEFKMVTHNFVNTLNALSIDPMLASAFKQDADVVLAYYSLSSEEKDLLKSADPEKLHEALSTTDESWAARIVVSPNIVRQCVPVLRV
jgi:hypothetical protein